MIWKTLDKEKPMAYQTGNWDGKRSDRVLVSDSERNYHIATMYEGFQDGSYFCDFYDTGDYMIENIMWWTEIESPI